MYLGSVVGKYVHFPEEFSAIGGWTTEAYLVVIPTAVSYRSRFRSFLLLGDREMDDLLDGGYVNMVRFASRFGHLDDHTIPDAVHRRALCYCLLHRYHFPSLMGDCARGDLRLMSVADQMEGGLSCATLVLGETILGLDSRFKRRDRAMTGSPPCIFGSWST